MLLLDDVYDIMGEEKLAQVKTNAFKTYLVIYSFLISNWQPNWELLSQPCTDTSSI